MGNSAPEDQSMDDRSLVDMIDPNDFDDEPTIDDGLEDILNAEPSESNYEYTSSPSEYRTSDKAQKLSLITQDDSDALSHLLQDRTVCLLDFGTDGIDVIPHDTRFVQPTMTDEYADNFTGALKLLIDTVAQDPESILLVTNFDQAIRAIDHIDYDMGEPFTRSLQDMVSRALEQDENKDVHIVVTSNDIDDKLVEFLDGIDPYFLHE